MRDHYIRQGEEAAIDPDDTQIGNEPLAPPPPLFTIPQESAADPITTRPVSLNSKENEQSTGRKSSAPGVISWTLGFLLVTAAFQFLAPHFAEQMQYSMTRGKQRAQYEIASEHLTHASLDGLSLASQMISQRLRPSVVHIDTDGDERATTRPLPKHRMRGQGSGVIIDADGYILTNRHVIESAETIRVRLSDGRLLQANVVGTDPLTDLALLKVSAGGLIAAEWGDSDELEVGSMVWAMGSPFGLQRSITFGILSAKDRAGSAGSPHQNFLQTDAAVNPGNSGGPLVDTHGRVVGINTAIVGDAYQGISFSIPSNVAKDIYERLRADRRVARGWLGVWLDAVTDEVAQRNGLESPRGALVRSVVAGPSSVSPAESAGIRPEDIIILWNDQQIDTPADLTIAVGRTRIGDEATVTVLRQGESLEFKVTVGERPETNAR